MSATSTADSDTLDELVVGSHVFHPAHGVATVAAIEKREFGEQRQEFYVLDLSLGGKLLLPTTNVETSGVRPLISAANARKLAKMVQTEPVLDETPWKERTANYADALASGVAKAYTETLRQLLFRARGSKLTTTERRAFDTARAYFVDEISLVLERAPEQVLAMLAEIADIPTD